MIMKIWGLKVLNMALLSLALLGVSSCGDAGLDKDKAAALLGEAVKDAPIYVSLPTSGTGLAAGYAELYGAQLGIIITTPLRLGGSRMAGLNTNFIDKKGWKRYLSMDGDDLAIINYYVSFKRVTGVIEPSTREGCSALAEYQVMMSKEVPWTNTYLERFADENGTPQTRTYTACFVKYDDGWRVKQAFMDVDYARQ